MPRKDISPSSGGGEKRIQWLKIKQAFERGGRSDGRGEECQEETWLAPQMMGLEKRPALLCKTVPLLAMASPELAISSFQN